MSHQKQFVASKFSLVIIRCHVGDLHVCVCVCVLKATKRVQVKDVYYPQKR